MGVELEPDYEKAAWDTLKEAEEIVRGRDEEITSLTTRVEAQAARIEELEGALEVIGRRADKTLLEASSRRDLEDGLSLVGMRASRALHGGDDDGE